MSISIASKPARAITALALVVGAIIVSGLAFHRGTAPAAATANAPTLADNFALLRSAPVTALPKKGQQQLKIATEQASTIGKDVSGVSRTFAGTTTAAAATYLTLVGDQACTTVLTPSGEGATGCGTANSDFAATDLGIGVTLVAGGYVVSGFAPDGTENAILDFADGSTRRLDIENNSYSVSTKTAPTAVRWQDSSGASHTFAPMDPGN
jgi:hypothetical protein